MSTTASDMEREDGSSKSMEVQAAPGTRSISVGRLFPFPFSFFLTLTIIDLGGIYALNTWYHRRKKLLPPAVSSAGLPENEDSSDMQDIIESTPELDMDLIGYKPCR